jgi:NAD(P)-dependent dehydrogenase (short-subunit alcohol dehydrogenase family)
MDKPEIVRNAEAKFRLPDGSSGFPEQQQQPPGLTDAMEPVPDHGEQTYVGHGRLEGLRALITGGDSGIGRAVAIAYAREGADVAINYLPAEQPDAEATAHWVTAAGRRVVLAPGDLTEQAACEQVVSETVSQLGGIEVLVNNAGYHWGRGEAGLAGLQFDELDRTLKTNLYGLFWLTKAVLPHLSSGACIINTSSVQAYDPSVQLIDYAATKAAINNITVNLAEELGPRGIRVNAVAPGPIWTPLQPATRESEKVQSFGAETPLGRAGQPAEMAGAYVFLAAPAEASYVSGTVVGVTGGRPVF